MELNRLYISDKFSRFLPLITLFTFQLISIRKDTSSLSYRSELAEHEPKLRLHELARQIEDGIRNRNSADNKDVGFKSAAQLLNDNIQKNETDSEKVKKKQARNLGAKRGFSFKRSPSHQTSMNSFFQKAPKTEKSEKKDHQLSDSDTENEGRSAGEANDEGEVKEEMETEDENDVKEESEAVNHEPKKEEDEHSDGYYDSEENVEFDQEEVELSDIELSDDDSQRKVSPFAKRGSLGFQMDVDEDSNKSIEKLNHCEKGFVPKNGKDYLKTDDDIENGRGKCEQDSFIPCSSRSNNTENVGSNSHPSNSGCYENEIGSSSHEDSRSNDSSKGQNLNEESVSSEGDLTSSSTKRKRVSSPSVPRKKLSIFEEVELFTKAMHGHTLKSPASDENKDISEGGLSEKSDGNGDKFKRGEKGEYKSNLFREKEDCKGLEIDRKESSKNAIKKQDFKDKDFLKEDDGQRRSMHNQEKGITDKVREHKRESHESRREKKYPFVSDGDSDKDVKSDSRNFKRKRSTSTDSSSKKPALLQEVDIFSTGDDESDKEKEVNDRQGKKNTIPNRIEKIKDCKKQNISSKINSNHDGKSKVSGNNSKGREMHHESKKSMREIDMFGAIDSDYDDDGDKHHRNKDKGCRVGQPEIRKDEFNSKVESGHDIKAKSRSSPKPHIISDSDSDNSKNKADKHSRSVGNHHIKESSSRHGNSHTSKNVYKGAYSTDDNSSVVKGKSKENPVRKTTVLKEIDMFGVPDTEDDSMEVPHEKVPKKSGKVKEKGERSKAVMDELDQCLFGSDGDSDVGSKSPRFSQKKNDDSNSERARSKGSPSPKRKEPVVISDSESDSYINKDLLSKSKHSRTTENYHKGSKGDSHLGGKIKEKNLHDGSDKKSEDKVVSKTKALKEIDIFGVPMSDEDDAGVEKKHMKTSKTAQKKDKKTKPKSDNLDKCLFGSDSESDVDVKRSPKAYSHKSSGAIVERVPGNDNSHRKAKEQLIQGEKFEHNTAKNKHISTKSDSGGGGAYTSSSEKRGDKYSSKDKLKYEKVSKSERQGKSKTMDKSVKKKKVLREIDLFANADSNDDSSKSEDDSSEDDIPENESVASHRQKDRSSELTGMNSTSSKALYKGSPEQNRIQTPESKHGAVEGKNHSLCSLTEDKNKFKELQEKSSLQKHNFSVHIKTSATSHKSHEVGNSPKKNEPTLVSPKNDVRRARETGQQSDTSRGREPGKHDKHQGKHHERSHKESSSKDRAHIEKERSKKYEERDHKKYEKNSKNQEVDDKDKGKYGHDSGRLEKVSRRHDNDSSKAPRDSSRSSDNSTKSHRDRDSRKLDNVSNRSDKDSSRSDRHSSRSSSKPDRDSSSSVGSGHFKDKSPSPSRRDHNFESKKMGNKEYNRKDKRSSGDMEDLGKSAEESRKHHREQKGESNHDKETEKRMHSSDRTRIDGEEKYDSSKRKKNSDHTDSSDNRSEASSLSKSSNNSTENINAKSNLFSEKRSRGYHRNILATSGMQEETSLDSSPLPQFFLVKKRDVSSELKPQKVQPSVDKKKLADWVVKHLMPYYKSKKIVGKDLFKSLARQLSHHAVEKECVVGEYVLFTHKHQ